MPGPTAPLRRARLGTPIALPLAVVVLAGALSACTGARPRLADETSTTAEATTTTEPEPRAVEVAEAKDDAIDLYGSPDAEDAGRRIEAGEDTSADTIPIVFLVKDRHDGDPRMEVYLPGAPSGSTAWVDADDVSLTAARYRIEVALSEHQLRVLRGDEVVLDEPVGVGCADRVTPGGVYYVKELLELPDPDGDFGPYAYGLSGFPDVLDSIDDDTDITAIHGTDDPDTVGSDVSSGCLRLDNDAIERMVDEIGLPLGTPLEVAA